MLALRIFTILFALSTALVHPAYAQTDSEANPVTRRVEKALKAAASNVTEDDDVDPDEVSDDDTSESSDSKADKSDSTKDEDNTTTAKELREKMDGPAKKAVVIYLTGSVVERKGGGGLFSDPSAGLDEYITLFRKLKNDKSVDTVLLRIGANDLGYAFVEEVRQAIGEMRAEKKKVIALLEDDSQLSYLLGLSADKIIMPPSSDLMLSGVSADSYFLRGLLAKLGVSVQIIHVGQYKSFGETFTHDDFTTPARENMEAVVDSLFHRFGSTVAADRDIDTSRAISLISGGPLSASEALEAKMVDAVQYDEQILSELKNKGLKVVSKDDYEDSGSKSKSSPSLISVISALSGGKSSDSTKSSSSSKYPKVAVVYALGPIASGTNGTGMVSSDEILADDFIAMLDEIKNDKSIKGVIMRVNSPGGSAFASDLIWKKIQELKTEKPVVASMSDVAASGGYYIAMAASKIVAQPSTVTGSIGVVGGKPNLKGLYDKIGVTKSSISRGDYAGMFSETSDFSEKERAKVETMMKRTYDDFVSKAAKDRKQTFEDLHKVAQGRIWTGQQALEVGLVDELGGYPEAIASIKKLIGLTTDDKVALSYYPEEKSFIEMLQKALGGGMTSARTMTTQSPLDMITAELPGGLRRAVEYGLSVSRMLQTERVLLTMPSVVQFR